MDTRQAMWRIRVAWMFGAAWAFTTTSLALTRYGECLGLPLFWFGVMSSMPYVGAFMALPTSYVIARYGHRKRLFMVAGIAYRSLWVVIALVPWVLPRAWWWPMLVVLQGFSSLGAYVMNPAVMSWFADVIPARIRGRFFSVWRLGGMIVGLVATLGVAELLDLAGPAHTVALTRTISILFAISAACGVSDFLWLARIPDPEHRPDPQIQLWALFREPLADRSFCCFLAYNATLTLGIGFLGQYVYLYLTHVLAMDNRLANLLNNVVPMLTILIVVRGWGRLVDRIGCKPVMIVCTVLVIHGAVSWIFVTPEHPWIGYLAILVAVAAWNGIDTANFNVMLRFSSSRGGKRQGTSYLAVNSVVVAAAGALSGLLGGGVAHWLGEEWRSTLFGLPLTYHGVLFIISGVLRLAALPWLFGIHEPGSRSAKEAVRYVLGRAATRIRGLAGAPFEGKEKN